MRGCVRGRGVPAGRVATVGVGTSVVGKQGTEEQHPEQEAREQQQAPHGRAENAARRSGTTRRVDHRAPGHTPTRATIR